MIDEIYNIFEPFLSSHFMGRNYTLIFLPCTIIVKAIASWRKIDDTPRRDIIFLFRYENTYALSPFDRWPLVNC